MKLSQSGCLLPSFWNIPSVSKFSSYVTKKTLPFKNDCPVTAFIVVSQETAAPIPQIKCGVMTVKKGTRTEIALL
jgi:hypothetical protein